MGIKQYKPTSPGRRGATGQRMYRLSPSTKWIRAMRAERLGSYSMAATLPGTPKLFRLKSMIRSWRLAPPPRWRTVIRPWALRPAFFLRGTTNAFSGLRLVISSKV